MAHVKATLSVNNDTCGPLEVLVGGRGSVHIEISSTITVSLQRKIGDGGYVTVKLPDGATAASWTSSISMLIDAPGTYQLLASGVSGGSAVCQLVSH